MIVNVVWFSLLFGLVTAQYDQRTFIFQDGTEFILTASSAPVILHDCPCTGEPDCCGLARNRFHTVEEHSSVDQDSDGWLPITRCLIYSKHQPTLTLCTSCPLWTLLDHDDCTIDSFHVKATCLFRSQPRVTAYFDSKMLDIPKMGKTIYLNFCKKSESTTQKGDDSTTRETFTTTKDREQTEDRTPKHVYTSTTTTTHTDISTSEPNVSETDSTHEKQATPTARFNPPTRPDLSITETARPWQSSTIEQNVGSTEPNLPTTGETNQKQSPGDDVPIPLIIGLVLGVCLILAVTAIIIVVLRRKTRPREDNRVVHTGSAFDGPYCVMGVNIMNCDRFERAADVDPPPDYFSAVQRSQAQHK